MKLGDWFIGGDAQQRFHFLAVGNRGLPDALVVGIQNARGALHLRGLAFDFEIVVLQMGRDLQGGLEEFQIFIEGAEKLVDAPGNSDGLLHSVSRSEALGRSLHTC